MGSAQLLARIQPPVLTAQPFPIEQSCAGELHAYAGEPVDRLAVQVLRDLTLAQQRPRAGLDPQRPISGTGVCDLRETLEGIGSGPRLAAANSRLDELNQAPVG